MIKIAVIALGGALGAVCRYLIVEKFFDDGKFPFSTLLVNSIGSFLMGIFFVFLVEKNVFSTEIKDFILIGFLSAFTTFSAVAFEVYYLAHNQNILIALLYIIASVILCVTMVFLGIHIMRLI
ncbi:MAG: fluoride efflux transporter CrcB [Pseudomonadota bacterium]|nr:fluoride efflux transporter CrcB [Pseudomonadota bacterium]